MSNIPTDISVKELLTEFSPKLAKEMIAESGVAAELAGTHVTMLIDVSGDIYSYIVKDGTDITVTQDVIDNPMVKMFITKEDLEKMIATNNLDMLLGMQSDLNKAKYNALVSMKGCINAELENEDGSAYFLKAIINGAEIPSATFKMKTSDSEALMKKETNPVNLFMSGAMKIEGDMAFAMATQPLFT